MAKNTPVPVEQAALIGERFKKDQVIIFSWSREELSAVVTTWGKTMHDSVLATDYGNKLKEQLRWSDEKCHTVSRRLLALKDELHEVRTNILDNVGLFGGGEQVNKIFDLLNRAIDRIDGKEVINEEV